ncbi:MAG: 2Fe-2S iron-sulfur cluster-binding protein [bacterium]|nr:2Fe-2S iron-sulfur cluster-binding protein [bacterium]
MTHPISLDVNGMTYGLEAGPDEPLALVLRNRLGLTGVKVGCGLEQCGYCTPGLVVAITGLLRGGPRPDDNAIRDALEPHLCRCGAHPRVLRAVRALAAEADR